MVAHDREKRAKRMTRFQNEWDKLLMELVGADRMMGRARTTFRPNADVYYSKSQQAIIVKLELCGIDPQSIRLEVEERVLRVQGQRLDEAGADKVYQQMEIAYGPFERRVLLPVDVDPEQAQASYERGFLVIGLPLPPKTEARRIPIDSETEQRDRNE